MVLVGDHRQLGPVGPGGALGALVTRQPEILHILTENIRQSDPIERQVLEELRSGRVAVAIDWYARHSRIYCQPDRDETLQRAIEGWVNDIQAGHDAALFAYQRANVAALNEQAREWMADHGRLYGPELAGFRAGDRVLTTAPVPGRLLNSERAMVLAVDPHRNQIDVETDDGRLVRLVGAELERLDYGYATTVHRSQGVTVDRAHIYADGGGRELAYVAMSRARKESRVYVVADDTAMAAEDLKRDWSRERRPIWAIDTGLAVIDDLTSEDVAELAPEAKARVMAMAQAETLGSTDPRCQALDRQLSAYRDRLDSINLARTAEMEI
jgi:ATP-dependent exoDNAse (exonuclease V) alpha subunit